MDREPASQHPAWHTDNKERFTTSEKATYFALKITEVKVDHKHIKRNNPVSLFTQHVQRLVGLS